MRSPVVATASVTAFLREDGTVTLMEVGSWRQDADEAPLTYTELYSVEGTCEPQELMYTLVTEMQQHV